MAASGLAAAPAAVRPSSASTKGRSRPGSAEAVPSLAALRRNLPDGAGRGCAMPFAASVAATSSAALPSRPAATQSRGSSGGLSLNELRQIVQSRAQVQLNAASVAPLTAVSSAAGERSDGTSAVQPQQHLVGVQFLRPSDVAGAVSGSGAAAAAGRRARSETGADRHRSQTWAPDAAVPPDGENAEHGGNGCTLEERQRASTTGGITSPTRRNTSKAAASWKRAAPAAMQKSLKQRRNPFVEYESREKRLTSERKWLQEDSVYMTERQEDLRHGAVQKSLATRTTSPEELYEKRTFFGSYSVKLKASRIPKPSRASPAGERIPGARAASAPAKRATCVAGSPPAASGFRREDASAASCIKTLKRDLEESQKGFREGDKISECPFSEAKQLVCACGNMFMDDAPTCRKCGKDRANIDLKKLMVAQLRNSSGRLSAANWHDA